MACPCCGVEDRRDDATGYSGDDICPGCSADGFTYTASGEIVNEREGEEEPVTSFDDIRRG